MRGLAHADAARLATAPDLNACASDDAGLNLGLCPGLWGGLWGLRIGPRRRLFIGHGAAWQQERGEQDQHGHAAGHCGG